MDNDAINTSTLYYPTWKKYACVYATVDRMSVKERRKIFSLIRTSDASEHTLLLAHGINIGDFCIMQILRDHAKK